MTDAPLIAALHARAKEAEAAAYDAQTDRETEAHTAVLAAVELLIASIDALAFIEGPYVPGKFVKHVPREPGTVRVVPIGVGERG